MSSTTGRILLVVLGVFALSLVVAARLKMPPPPVAAPAPPVAPAAPTPVVPAPTLPHAPAIVVALPQRPLLPSGLRFDPSGRFVAQVRAGSELCEVWNLELGLFVGEVPAGRCASWRPGTCVDFRPPARREASPEPEAAEPPQFGQSCLAWPTSELTATTAAAQGPPVSVRASAALVRVRGLPGAPQAEMPLRPECDGDACTDVVGLALRPDGKQLLIARKGQSQLRIIDLASSRPVATLALGDREQLQPLMLVWGRAGILAVVAAPGHDVLADQTGYINTQRIIYQWSDPQLPPRKTECGAEVNVTNAAHLLDPSGRYLFMLQHFERSGDAFEVQDARPPLAGPDGLRGGDFRSALGRPRHLGQPYSPCDVETELTGGRWLPGPFPVWETVEITRTSCSGGESVERTARLLHTAPAFRRMTRVKLESAAAVQAPRRVSADGKSVLAGAGRKATLPEGFEAALTGAGKDALRRLSDGEILYYPEEGDCFHTERGAISCPRAAQLRGRAYRLGPDALTDEAIRGDQLAWLLYTPSLVDDFFAGRPLPPARSEPRAGLPPTLKLLSVEHLDSVRPNLELKLAAGDGGDGFSVLRVRVGDQLQTESFPIGRDGVGKVALSLDPKVCDYAYIYACSKGGVVCSRPVTAPFCPESKHVPDDNPLYEEHHQN